MSFFKTGIEYQTYINYRHQIDIIFMSSFVIEVLEVMYASNSDITLLSCVCHFKVLKCIHISNTDIIPISSLCQFQVLKLMYKSNIDISMMSLEYQTEIFDCDTHKMSY